MNDVRQLNQLERLFGVQMWLFGCDARHPSGNLFAARGMTRLPPRADTAISSTWRETVCADSTLCGATVALNSVGVTLEHCGSALRLERGPLGPQLRAAPVALVPALARWVLDWETWVDHHAGVGWRAFTLAQRRGPGSWSVVSVRERWAEFAAPDE